MLSPLQCDIIIGNKHNGKGIVVHMEKINHEEFITEMIRYASSAESPDRIINQILQYICQNLRSDRAYIFEDNLDGTYSNTYEYCREGVSAEIENLQNVPYNGHAGSMVHRIQKVTQYYHL